MTDRSFTTECPVCMEELFNEEGIAIKDVAETMCLHLIHSTCLQETGRALNSDGKRFGIGGFGPRSGCPICNTPVSMWENKKRASEFPAFWIARIEKSAQDIGPTISDGGEKEPLNCEVLREKLKQDSTLTQEQKDVIRKPLYEPNVFGCGLEDADSGFYKALKQAGSVNYSRDQVMFASWLKTRGIWKYDEATDTIWLWEWGIQHPKSSCCNNCGAQPSNLKICSNCRDSCEAPMYCSKECQKADWPKHKKTLCQYFQIMKQGGTNEELLERLRSRRL